MADDTWSSDAIKAIRISICRPGAERAERVDTFHPVFAEQFFGQSQSIFGYRDLNINISFTAHDLYPNATVKYGQKFPKLGSTEATDIQQVLSEYLPSYAFESEELFNERVVEPAIDFTPPGKLVESYDVDGRRYEIWLGELRDPAVRTLIERFQILIPMFIDGGLALNVHDQDWTLERWRVFIVYEKLPSPPTPTASPYSIVGYSTAYRFLTYQPSTSAQFTKTSDLAAFPSADTLAVASLPNKSRISQFLVLPTHHQQGHGARLYARMMATFGADPACVEITVEDPNEAFDDLRDVNDYARLLATAPSFRALALAAPDPKRPPRRTARLPTAALLGHSRADLERLRTAHKLAPRQFARLVELRLLDRIPAHARRVGATRLTRKAASPDPADRALYWWRLLVKQRIYRLHRDLLVQVEAEERVEKLEQALETQTADYERLLAKMALGAGRRVVDREEEQEGEGRAGVARRPKRKVVEDDEEDEEDEVDGEGRAAKRPKENGTAVVVVDGAPEDARGQKRPREEQEGS